MSRKVEIDWIRKPGKKPATKEQRDVGWNGLQHHLGTLCAQLPITVNDRTLTEQAAIAVMALQINDLEGAELQTVLQIGSGGDYLIRLRGGKTALQVESSGIKVDVAGNISRSRLGQKSQQVLTHSRVGFASVTTFSYQAGAIVHSYLHYVRHQKKGKGGMKGKKK